MSYCKCGEESVGDCVVCARPVCGYHSAFYNGLRVCDEDRTEAKHDLSTEQQHALLATETVTYIGFERAMADAGSIEDIQRHVGMERDPALLWAAARRVLHDSGVRPDVEVCELTVRVTAGVLSKAFSTAQVSVDERLPCWSVPALPGVAGVAPIVLGVHGGLWRIEPAGRRERVLADHTEQYRFAVVAPPGTRLKLTRGGGEGGRGWTVPGRPATAGMVGAAGLDLRRAGMASGVCDELAKPVTIG